MSYQQLRFTPKYFHIDTKSGFKYIRSCDGPNCNETLGLIKYPTDKSYCLMFCQDHIDNPYNVIGNPVHQLELPKFDRSEYQILTEEQVKLCGYRGCNAMNGLKPMFGHYFCPTHCKDMMEIRVKYVNKKDPHDILINKIKEFNCYKILNLKIFDEINQLQNELRVFYTHIPINLVHIEYTRDNLKIWEQYRSNLSSERSSLNSSSETLSRSESPYRPESPNYESKSSVKINPELVKSQNIETLRNFQVINNMNNSSNSNNLRLSKSLNDHRETKKTEFFPIRDNLVNRGTLATKREILPPKQDSPEIKVKYKPPVINQRDEKMKQSLFQHNQNFFNNPYSYFVIDPCVFVKNPVLGMHN